MQASTGAIISGSFAFQFFMRSHYPWSDLDIYVGHQQRKIVGQWLLQHGYTYSPGINLEGVPDLNQPSMYDEAIESLDRANLVDDFYCAGVLGVLDFVGRRNGLVKNVQLVVVDVCPIRTVLNFHSSMCYLIRRLFSNHRLPACVMNIITWETAYCLYPVDTIEKERTLFLLEHDRAILRAKLKYRQRGIRDHWLVEDNKFHVRQLRWIEDPHAWVYPLERLNSNIIPSTYIDPIRTTTWSILSIPEEHHRIYFHTVSPDEDITIFPLVVATESFKAYLENQLCYLKQQKMLLSNENPGIIGENS